MSDLRRLRTNLCRELALSEHEARVRVASEAARHGEAPPARALRAIAAHAEALRPRFAALMQRDQTLGLGLGQAVGALLGALRRGVLDRLRGTERSYRATLLALRQGVDTARLLREVALHAGDRFLVGFCDELLVERLGLLEAAEQALAWFAEHPRHALRSGAGRTWAHWGPDRGALPAAASPGKPARAEAHGRAPAHAPGPS